MTFSDSIKTCFRKSFVWKGRASRSEYWWFHLFGFAGPFVLGAALGFVFSDTFVTVNQDSGVVYDEDATVIKIAGYMERVFLLIVFFPWLSVIARRLHDQNLSAWYLILALIPLVNLFVLVPKGTNGENQYGPDSAPSSQPLTLPTRYEGFFPPQ